MISIQVYYTQPSLASISGEICKLVPAVELAYTQFPPLLAISLVFQDDGLWVHSQQFKPFSLRQFYTDFIARRGSDLKREMLLQAINLTSTVDEPLRALDISAGLGRDSLLLALAGFQVTMVENNPYLAIILSYLCYEFKAQLPHLRLFYADSAQLLADFPADVEFEVIYIDPMFADNKQALAKKDLQLIDLFIQHNPLVARPLGEFKHLFSQCKLHCLKKIVVKRDNKQPALLLSPRATYSKSGKTIRFDVYQC